MAHEAREHPLDGAHRLKREMGKEVSNLARDASRFFASERGEVDVREHELDVLNAPIEAGARRREEARALPRFIPRKREEANEEHERNEDEK